MKGNKKKSVVLLVLAVIVFAGMGAYNPPTGEFKNLQILPQDITKDSLDKIMHHFNDALGVKCNFCHVRDAAANKMIFDSDDKEEKGFARHMMRMTMAINANYFNFENSNKPDTISVVTCNTCHRGEPHPDKETIGEPGH